MYVCVLCVYTYVYKCIHVSIGRQMIYNTIVLRSEDNLKCWCSSSTLFETALSSLSYASANFSLVVQKASEDFPNSTYHLIIGVNGFQTCVNMHAFHMIPGDLNLESHSCMQVLSP